MLKLIKYELKKQLFSKYIILLGLLLLEIYFVYAVIADSNKSGESNKVVSAIVLLFFAAFVVIIYAAFESITTFHKDLKTKQSYMLFMVPKSTYTIVGAKVLAAFLQMVLIGLAFIAITVIDFSIIMAKYGGFKEAVEFLKDFINLYFRSDFNVMYFIFAALLGILQWFTFMMIAMLSITLANTFLENSRWKGIISIVIFILINIVANRILRFIMPNVLNSSVKIIIISSIYTLAEGVLAYFVTAWMLDKKVSV